MRISYNWLKEYVDIKLSPEKLAETLTMAGLSVESLSKSGGDSVLEIEITANRPDWLSYIGVAREVAALAGAKLRLPKVSGSKTKASRPGVKVTVEDKTLCPRYTARVIRGVKVAESPAWLRERIEEMGLRPVNNIVDITNFCLFETGEPMHAFDLGKISNSAIIVRAARKGEKITVIDGSQKALDESMLVIADADKPVAIAGVMGGLNTEVTYSTQDILLEAAYFDPVSIRRTSRKLALSSESSYRFERRVDRGNIRYASDRAAGLILEIAGGKAEGPIDIDTAKEKHRSISLRFDRLESVLGLAIQPAKARSILSALGMKISGSGPNGLKLEAPGFRHDLKEEIDVIEEVARIYGYANIPSTLPRIVEQPVRVEREMSVKNAIHRTLAAMGVDEIMTYSLLGKKAISASGLPHEDAVEVRNPLTSEQEAMRTSLIPGMLGAISWNINRKSADLKLYELSNVYSKEGGAGPRESLHLAIAVTGQVFGSWAGGAREAGFFELKGIVESLLGSLGIKDVSFESAKHSAFVGSQCAAVLAGGERFAIMGQVSRKALDGFDIKEKVFVFEAFAAAIVKHAGLEKHFEGLARFPSVTRDISIIVSDGARNSDIVSVITAAAGTLLKNACLIDRYKGRQIPQDKVSLTYRLEYQDPARTLEDKDITPIHSAVLKSLDEKLGAKLR